MRLFQIIVITFLFFSGVSCHHSTPKWDPGEISDKPFQPFKVLYVKHPVENFYRWKTIYDANDSIRKTFKINTFQIGRGTDDSDMITVMSRIDDIQNAKMYASNNDIKKKMHDAGVTDEPLYFYLDLIRSENSKIDINERLIISYKVKKFIDWLKLYNEEGTETRKTYGIVDRGLARDIDNPNVLYLVYAVADKEKVKLHLQSDNFKNFMNDAGVLGAPVFSYYKIYNGL